MAGKHSKKFFERKSRQVIAFNQSERKQLSLPFKIIISAVSVSLCLSLVLVGAYFVPSNINSKLLQKTAATFEAEGLVALTEQNSNIKGWLKIDGADISCAVCQTDNDTYFINHNQNGKKSRYGALFLSSSDSFVRGGDKNIVIYGNNMKDGSMFGSLKKYRNLNFYKQNPSIKLYYDNEFESYIIFAVMLVGSSADDGGDSVYNPSKSYFVSETEFDEWYAETSQRSLINTTVTAEYGDEFLTLVTVADDFDGARLVVMAKKSTEWEISQTDVTGAGVNPKIKYPKIWYTERGLQYPYQ